MNNKISIPMLYRFLFLSMLVMFTAIACNPSGSENSVAPDVTVVVSNDSDVLSESEDDAEQSVDNGYPSGITETDLVATGYPGQPAPPEGMSEQPPDPERELEPQSPELGAVGGVLIREIVDTGFIPVIPRDLYLGKILTDSEGRQALIARGEDALKAELFSTGVFAFNGVPPGTYGLVIDLGFTEFPLVNEDGSEMLVIVEAGKSFDLGQIFVDVPTP